MIDRNTIRMEVSFDEFNLDVAIQLSGTGAGISRGGGPDKMELRTDPQATVRLAGFLVSPSMAAIGLSATTEGETCHVALHFDH